MVVDVGSNRDLENDRLTFEIPVPTVELGVPLIFTGEIGENPLKSLVGDFVRGRRRIGHVTYFRITDRNSRNIEPSGDSNRERNCDSLRVRPEHFCQTDSLVILIVLRSFPQTRKLRVERSFQVDIRSRNLKSAEKFL